MERLVEIKLLSDTGWLILGYEDIHPHWRNIREADGDGVILGPQAGTSVNSPQRAVGKVEAVYSIFRVQEGVFPRRLGAGAWMWHLLA